MGTKNIFYYVGLLSFGLMLLVSCQSNKKQKTATTNQGPQTDTVIIKQMKFIPAHITIHPGDTIVWINKGIVQHNVTQDSLQTWSSGKIPIGEIWKTVPKQSDNYFCTIHPTMKGTITLSDK